MELDTIRFAKRDRAAFVTLNRPEALNAISWKMIDELNDVIAEVKRDRSIKAMVITGQGRAFSVGADIEALANGLEDPALMRQYLETLNELFHSLEALPLPVIAAINGLTRAGGFELLLSCDLAVAAEDAKIGDNHTPFGAMPGGGATQRAPRKLGMQKALELIYTGRWLTGREAEAYGIVLKAVPAEQLDSAVEEVLGQLRDKSRDCLGFVKRAALGGMNLPLVQGVNLEIRYFLEYLSTSADFREGVTAYRERRRPSFAEGQAGL